MLIEIVMPLLSVITLVSALIAILAGIYTELKLKMFHE